MCGICGIAIPRAVGGTVDVDRIRRMAHTIEHRGPDGSGEYVGEGVGLGHRRLSIVDVEGGRQPMASDDGRLHLVYNGEIYNHPDLMAHLKADGVPYHTHCDTESLLRWYEREGLDAVRRFRGMFAFAIWHVDQRKLVLVRDRFGIKPLYYHLSQDGTLTFGSEIKAILAAGVGVALNLDSLPDFLANHSTFGDETLFAGIRRLPAGHTLTWQDGRVSIERYWDLAMGGPRAEGSDADLIQEYRERLTEAVRLRLMADVPLGAFLSGGIDSAAITALMSSLIDDQVKTFSVAFAEREANELAYARQVAERFRTDHREIVVHPDDFWRAVPRMVWFEDEPMAHPSSVPLHFVARLARERVKVVLTGEGSDETLAGYNRYRVTLLNLQMGRRYGHIPSPLRHAVRGGIGLLPAASKWRRRLSRTFLVMPADLEAIYLDNFAVFGRNRQATLLDPSLRERTRSLDPYAAYHQATERCGSDDLLDQMLYADSSTYLHELLMKQDQMSMGASIESRVPFLDHPLVEFAARLPRHLKLKGWTTKVVLREAMRDVLPETILRRRKMGFPVPVGPWLRGPYRAIVEEFVLSDRARSRGLFREEALRTLVAEHDAGAGGHQERLWSLVNLEVWQRIFIDGEAVEDVTMVPGLTAMAGSV
ncbi:MAG: asparagine synthase (glutamine-hydrolyzing) [Gemmatimonadota bacterium]